MADFARLKHSKTYDTIPQLFKSMLSAILFATVLVSFPRKYILLGLSRIFPIGKSGQKEKWTAQAVVRLAANSQSRILLFFYLWLRLSRSTCCRSVRSVKRSM